MSLLIGRGAHQDGKFNVDSDLDVFRIPKSIDEPALGLFSSEHQDRRLIFRTKHPVLTSDECAAVIGIVDEYVSIKVTHVETINVI